MVLVTAIIMVSSLSLFSVVTIHYSFHRTPVTKTLATWRNGIDQSNHSLPPSPPLLSLSHTHTHSRYSSISTNTYTRGTHDFNPLGHVPDSIFWLIFLITSLFMYVDQKFCLTSRKFCCAGDKKSNIAS